MIIHEIGFWFHIQFASACEDNFSYSTRNRVVVVSDTRNFIRSIQLALANIWISLFILLSLVQIGLIFIFLFWSVNVCGWWWLRWRAKRMNSSRLFSAFSEFYCLVLAAARRFLFKRIRWSLFLWLVNEIYEIFVASDRSTSLLYSRFSRFGGRRENSEKWNLKSGSGWTKRANRRNTKNWFITSWLLA